MNFGYRPIGIPFFERFSLEYSLVPHRSSERPLLAVVIDTEEEFDWSSSFNRCQTAITHVRFIDLFQRIARAFGIVPTYVVDFPVASQKAAIAPLREYSPATSARPTFSSRR